MKNTWKRTIAILLSVLLAFTALPMALAATDVASGSAGTAVNYALDSDGVLKISGAGPMMTYTGPSVVPWASRVASVKQVIISSGVTSIGAFAFSGCTALESVSIPNGLIKIENNAFDGCSSLRIVSIPNTTSEIGAYAFNNCPKLDTISILNTSCNIANGGTTISNTAKIYGYTGSTAEKYAKDYGRTFVSLNSGSQQVEDNPAAISGTSLGSLDQILKAIMSFAQPLIDMFKNLLTSLFANAGKNDATSTTGTTGTTGTGTTNTGTAAAAGNVASILSGIFSSFSSFVSSTLNSMNAGQNTGTATSTTAATGTTAATNDSTANAAAFFVNMIKGLFSSATNAASAATTTTK